MRTVDGSIVGEWLKPRTIVPVNLDEISSSSSNVEELMIIGDVNKIPTILISTIDVRIQSVVGTIILKHISILIAYYKCYVEMVICETEKRSDALWELMMFFGYKLTPIESVDVHISV